MRPTKAIVSLKAIRNNIKHLRRKIGKDIQILACVKTDAYGHGIEKVSEAIHEDVDYLGVASVDEGILLRKRDINLPILILNCILPKEAEEVVKYNLSQTLCSLEIAYSLNKEAAKRNRRVKVHIDIDTGMGRIGVKLPDARLPKDLFGGQAIDFIKKVKKLKNLQIEGIFTHFPSADESDRNFTYQQIQTFAKLVKKIEVNGIKIPLKHTANSAAILGFPESYFNMVRPGLMIYGYYPSPYVKRTVKLEPALSLITKIVCLRKLPKGATISYGRTYITPRPSMIATLPIGYGDGYSRALSNKGEVIIRGIRAPVVGRICMDQTMVDVSKVPNVKVGDEIVLI